MMHESIILWFAFFVELNKELYLKGQYLSIDFNAIIFVIENRVLFSSCFKQCSENAESGDEGGDLPPLSVSDYS